MKINRIGFPCLTVDKGWTTGHTLREINLNEERVIKVIESNISDMIKILNWMGTIDSKLRLFRISSDFIPFATHKKNIWNWKDMFSNKLSKIGEHFCKYNYRFSIHAMPFVVLNSPKTWVVENSIKELIYYTEFMELMGLDKTHKIIIHPGGVYENKIESTKRLISCINNLPNNIKNRLVLENDDKNYSFRDVLEICKKIEIPPLFDIHHFYCYPSKNIIKDLNESLLLWDTTPKIHASSSKANARHGTHDDFITNLMLKRITKIIPFNIDIMFECKKKEVAAIKALKYLQENNHFME